MEAKPEEEGVGKAATNEAEHLWSLPPHLGKPSNGLMVCGQDMAACQTDFWSTFLVLCQELKEGIILKAKQ